jgi:3-methyladenine DNA glycosylase Mpg
MTMPKTKDINPEYVSDLYTRAQTADLSAVLFARVAKGESSRVAAAAKQRGITAAALVRIVMLEWLEANKTNKEAKTAAPKRGKLTTALYVRVSEKMSDLVNATAKKREITAGELVRTVMLEWLDKQKA